MIMMMITMMTTTCPRPWTTQWLTEGCTVLIQKSKAKGLIPSNYRPITCLCTVWKMLNGISADEVYTHFESQNVILVELKGCRKNISGTKDQLLIDKLFYLTVGQNIRTRNFCG